MPSSSRMMLYGPMRSEMLLPMCFQVMMPFLFRMKVEGAARPGSMRP